MLPTEFTPEERAEFQRELQAERRYGERIEARAKADPCRTYRCTCGNEEDALYVAWWGTDCNCGLRMEGVTEPVAVGA